MYLLLVESRLEISLVINLCGCASVDRRLTVTTFVAGIASFVYRYPDSRFYPVIHCHVSDGFAMDDLN